MPNPPIPDRVVGPGRADACSRATTSATGQKVFLDNGLMEYGSIFGHGAYLGPDFTADYLHRARARRAPPYGGGSSDRAAPARSPDFQTNRYDEPTRHAQFTAAQAQAHPALGRRTTATSSASRRPSTACGPTRSPTRRRSAS